MGKGTVWELHRNCIRSNTDVCFATKLKPLLSHTFTVQQCYNSGSAGPVGCVWTSLSSLSLSVAASCIYKSEGLISTLFYKIETKLKNLRLVYFQITICKLFLFFMVHVI